MEVRLTYLDYVELMGDRRPPKHVAPAPPRRPKRKWWLR